MAQSCLETPQIVTWSGHTDFLIKRIYQHAWTTEYNTTEYKQQQRKNRKKKKNTIISFTEQVQTYADQLL